MMTIRSHTCVLVLALLWHGCASHVAPTATAPQPAPPQHQPPAPDRFHGQVVRSDGSPAAGAVLIISDAQKGGVLSMLRAGPDGHFEADLPRGVYAVTATLPDQSLYAPSVDGARGRVELRLDASCERFTGRIHTRSPLGTDAIASVGRFSKEVGDRFGAAVAADGTFAACVPAATYGVLPPDRFAVRDAIAVVPYSAGTFEYRTDAIEETDRVPADMSGITPASADAFVAALPTSTRLLGLAESNHGTRDFYGERTALVTNLATRQRVRLMLIEAGYGEALALDDYVNGAKVDIAHAVQALGYWTWDTKTFLQTLSTIRDYNAALPANKRIHVIGFDIQNTAGAIEYLKQAGSSALSQAETAALTPLATDDGKAWPTLPADQRASIRATLERIAATRAVGSATSRKNRVALAARSLLLHFDLAEATNEWADADLRDLGMARMVVEVLATEPASRATLWAHLGHLSREFVVGQHTMGAHLAQAFGDAYRVYGLFALGGSARAWDNKQEVGVIASTLPAAPAHSLEAVLAAQSGGAHVSYWTFAHAKGDAARWLSGVHPLRWFGAVFRRDGNEFAYWDLQTLDGAIIFDSVSPTEPTPTGERRVTAKAH